MKFRKKPVVIEAIQIKSDNVSEILEWMGGIGITSAGYDNNDMPFIVIQTLEGEMTGLLGSWIIKGVAGEFYPIKNEIFQKTYEPVKDEV